MLLKNRNILFILLLLWSVTPLYADTFTPFADNNGDMPVVNAGVANRTSVRTTGTKAVSRQSSSAVRAGSSYKVLPSYGSSSGVVGSSGVGGFGGVGSMSGYSSHQYRSADNLTISARAGVSGVVSPFGTSESTNTVMSAPKRPDGPGIGVLVPIGDAMWFMLLLPLGYAVLLLRKRKSVDD